MDYNKLPEIFAERVKHKEASNINFKQLAEAIEENFISIHELGLISLDYFIEEFLKERFNVTNESLTQELETVYNEYWNETS